ncbi:MAG: DUF3298 and DUF4163 domain-containing protein [Treponema sp.]|jgi:hypothetical protein|nr:DUF3298 and DUF4163 domain-containing protein [Treponema sp.]
MKKNIFYTVLPGVLSLALICACQTAPGKNGGARFITFSEKKSIPLTGSGEPAMMQEFNLLDLEDGDPDSALFRSLVYGGQTAKQYAAERGELYRTEYLEAKNSFRNGDEYGQSMNWYHSETVSLITESPRIRVFSKTGESFTGGAHGMREQRYFVIDRLSGRQIDTAFIIKNGAEGELTALINEALRSRMDPGSGTTLKDGGFFEETVEITENFFLDRAGMSFHWDQYEIAPYSMGPIEVSIPWKQLSALLSAEGEAIRRDLR